MFRVLHVSRIHVSIVRRNYCIYATLVFYAFYSSCDFRDPTSDFRLLLIPPIHGTKGGFVSEYLLY